MNENENRKGKLSNQTQTNNIGNINYSNLSDKEQTQLLHITNLQKQIDNLNAEPESLTVTDYLNEKEVTNKPPVSSGFRRELTEREKVEQELKKWNKEQTKVLCTYKIDGET